MEYIIIAFIIILLIPLSYLLFLIVFDFNPEAIEDSILINPNVLKVPDEFSVTTFNIGYCSLDKENDFFFEGGENTRGISKEIVERNLLEISKNIDELKSDVFLIQEVDESGSRSHNVKQLEHLTTRFDSYNSSFAYNYKIKYLFYPFKKPMGSANGGLLTLSKFDIVDSKRYKFKKEESFPRKLFFLKRCMVVNILKTKDQKDIYIINIHLSAYDKGGAIKKQQTDFLIEYIDAIYDESKNYIIVGGDWNQLLPQETYTKDMPFWLNPLPEEIYESKYKLVFDSSVNTVRSDEKPYVKGENFETVIDGFLVSPNLDLVSVKTLDLGFKNSDHNPVTAVFRLKNGGN